MELPRDYLSFNLLSTLSKSFCIYRFNFYEKHIADILLLYFISIQPTI